ncbi:MAG: HAD hydrolase family protein [Bacteroidetes bacterium]|nr:HAD hydrolase family protein [Bacteroidota bacterium]
MKDKIIALIPLRGGSKSILNKNIKSLAGKPLCLYSLEAAHQSGVFDEVIVSTDSEEIADVVRKAGLGTKISMRPAELATDTASTEAVMLHIASEFSFDVMCLIQATSPFTTAEDFQKAYQKFTKENLDSLVTGVRTKRFFWNENGTAVNYNPLKRPRRQDFDGYIMENGAFYFTKKEILEKEQCRLGGKIGVYEMPEHTALEIDEPFDWQLAEFYIKKYSQQNLTDVVKKIKVFVTDVDGTLTDAGMYYSPDGELLKKFNTRDAKGMELLRDKLGIRIVILTKENSPIVTARAKKLKIEDCYIGVDDKLTFLKEFCSKNDYSMDEIAFCGDDVNDLECLQNIGFPSCPANAEEEIKSASIYKAKVDGGYGAVRDICNFILSQRQQ